MHDIQTHANTDTHAGMQMQEIACKHHFFRSDLLHLSACLFIWIEWIHNGGGLEECMVPERKEGKILSWMTCKNKSSDKRLLQYGITGSPKYIYLSYKLSLLQSAFNISLLHILAKGKCWVGIKKEIQTIKSWMTKHDGASTDGEQRMEQLGG